MPGRPRVSCGWPAPSRRRSSSRRTALDVNGKSIMGVMMLAAECGSSITIRANGPDAEAGGAGAGRARGQRVRGDRGVTRRSGGSASRPAWRARRRSSCGWTFRRCRTAPSSPSTSTPRCGGFARRWSMSSPTCRSWASACFSAPGPRSPASSTRRSSWRRTSDFLASVETLIRNNQLSAETAYEFKALELRNLVVRRRPPAGAPGRPPRHPAPDAQPAHGRSGARALVHARR